VFAIVVLLLAAVGLLIAALGTGYTGLAWGSVALSVVAAVMILRRWRRSWLQHQDAPVVTASAEVDAPPSENILLSENTLPDENAPDENAQAAEFTEEDTDAADLLVVYELTDEVLVVDEHPRYHLPRCRFPEHARGVALPVREARELGFTPCGRCRPDTTLARRHRAARAAITGKS
jgi:hypothetical protein